MDLSRRALAVLRDEEEEKAGLGIKDYTSLRNDQISWHYTTKEKQPQQQQQHMSLATRSVHPAWSVICISAY